MEVITACLPSRSTIAVNHRNAQLTTACRRAQHAYRSIVTEVVALAFLVEHYECASHQVCGDLFRLHMRNSSLLAPDHSRYASNGMLSHLVVFPLHRANKQSVNSFSRRESSCAAVLSRYLFPSDAGRLNFDPRNVFHSPSRCVIDMIFFPSAPLDGLMLLKRLLLASVRVSFITLRMLPTDSAPPMSPRTLLM